jgi:3-hydroxyisobutyrate dehydrogenase-like beta-hydroxyacid dehydrogenase
MGTGRLSVVGLGVMGSALARRLLAAGFDPCVHDRTRAKADALARDGARAASSPVSAVADADVVVLSLSDETAVDQVLFGRLAPHLRRGATVVDTSTVSPSYARCAAQRLAAVGVHHVEACLIGNPAMAQEGRLRVLAGGDRRDVERVADVLTAIGTLGVRYVGPPGAASALKLAFNLLLGAQTVALAEAVAVATTAGIHRDDVLTAITESGFSSPVLAYRARFMRERRYRPATFRAELMAKDLRLLVREGSEAGLALPLAECAAVRFDDVVRAGGADADAAVVAEPPGRVAAPDRAEEKEIRS